MITYPLGQAAKSGPSAIIESGAVLAGGNIIQNSHISKDTYLGPDTELVDVVLIGRRLMNLRLGSK